MKQLPAPVLAPAIDESLQSLALAYDAGYDERAMIHLEKLLAMSVPVETIAQALGVADAVVWAMISSRPKLKQAEADSASIQASILRQRLVKGAAHVIDAIQDVAVAGEKEAVRMQAAEVYRKMLVDAGLFGGGKESQSVQVGFEGADGSRLAVLLGGRKVTHDDD